MNILDSITPFKENNVKQYSLPWINDRTRDVKRQCRKADRKWKKDKLVVSLDTLKGLMSTYQSAVKDARNSYFSNLISIASVTIPGSFFRPLTQ